MRKRQQQVRRVNSRQKSAAEIAERWRLALPYYGKRAGAAVAAALAIWLLNHFGIVPGAYAQWTNLAFQLTLVLSGCYLMLAAMALVYVRGSANTQ